MSDIDRTRVDHVLEDLCQSGCGRVREIIQEIEQGELPESVAQLNTDEQVLLLEELAAVMHAYKRTCPA